VVVLALEPVFPDEPAQPDPGEAPLRTLTLRHLADRPGEVRRDRAVGIEALRLGLDQEPGNEEPVLLELRHDIELRIRQDQRRHASPIRIASSRRNSHSTITPTSAVLRLWIGDHTSSSQPSIPLFNLPERIATRKLRTHVPAKNRHPFTNRFSAKNTTLLRAER